MWEKLKLNLIIFIILLIVSASGYMLHYILFGNVYDTISVILLTLGYVPIGILYEMAIVNKILQSKEQSKITRKKNVILSSFFYQVGTEMLIFFIESDEKIIELEKYYSINLDWEVENFQILRSVFEEYSCSINIDKIDFKVLSESLISNGKFLLELISNSAFEEQKDVNEMIMSLLHLRDELSCRWKEVALEEYLKEHIVDDMSKCYKLLLLNWVDYMEDMKGFYPSLYVRTLINSPFNIKNMKN